MESIEVAVVEPSFVAEDVPLVDIDDLSEVLLVEDDISVVVEDISMELELLVDTIFELDVDCPVEVEYSLVDMVEPSVTLLVEGDVSVDEDDLSVDVTLAVDEDPIVPVDDPEVDETEDVSVGPLVVDSVPVDVDELSVED